MAGRVGIVGIGIMGTAMMRNLLRHSFEVVGYDIGDGAMARLAEAGGIAATSPRDVAEKAEILITSLPNVDAFEQVMAGQGGIASSNGTGQIVIECSTLPIEAKARGHAQLVAQGKILLDCPVSGTGAQAANKDLVVFASGDEAAFERCREVLAGMSRAQKYVGAFGNGSRMKFIANHLVTIHNLASAEAFVLGEMAGLDPALVFDVIVDSAGSSRMFQIRGPMMVRGQYDEPTATMTNSFEGPRHHRQICSRPPLSDAALHCRGAVLSCWRRARPRRPGHRRGLRRAGKARRDRAEAVSDAK